MFSTWTLSRETCRLLAQRVAELQPAVAVEFGSGLSTALLAPWCDLLVSLDHDRRHAAPWRCVRICDVVDGSYDTALPDGIEFALIDGPPAKRHGRHGTFPHLWPRLDDDFEVWLDDADRPHEQDLLRTWQDTYPITVEYVCGTPKGLAIIRPAR